MNEPTFTGWLSSGAPALWAGFFMLAGWIVRTWPVWKQRVTEARASDDALVGAQWTRFQNEIARLVTRVGDLEDKYQRLEESEQRCREELADAKGRIAELEGYNIGTGSARQEAAGIVAAERLGKDVKP